ncbi:MAG TPA: ExeM/NucH family extracellular endonuclease [Thermoanaerobaculia bacterium]|nr:ExeM/NucH family extracellular endonuclease [Thermoanaerobaculia bacterium]
MLKSLRALLPIGLVLALVPTCVTAQTTYTWNQTGTASYATATNWTPTRTTPAVNDILVFNNGATTTVTGVPTQTIGQLLASSNTNVTLQSAGAVTLTINGGTGTDLQVDVGSQLNFTGTANAITMALAAGATGSIGGSMTLSGTASVAHRLTAASASGITFQSGSTFTEGTNFSGNPFGTTSLSSVVFAAGSTFVFLAGSNPFGAAAPTSVVVFQTGSLYRHQSSNTPSFSGRTYANYEQNVASTITPTGGSAVVMDNLTVTLGTLNFNMTGTPGHSIRGNVSVAAGATLSFSPASAGTVNLNGPAAQSIASAGTLTFGANSTINVNNANGITLGSDVTFGAGTLQLSSGNITTGANTLIIGSGASVNRTSGHVIGNLRKDFSANGSKVFEVGTANGYSPFTANVTAGTPGNITCAAVQGTQPNMNPATSIQRYWSLAATPGITADLTFAYLAGDVVGNEAVYKVFRVSGGIPTSFPGSTVNAGTHTGTVSGISAFSDWTVGEDVPPPLSLSINDVSLSEGNAGTTTFTFTVSLSAPAGAGGVTFDIATADNTATQPGDYTQKSLTSQTIPAGSSTYTFDVLVNGDTTPELDETFFVNVTNASNAVIADGQGQGTIVNDDLFRIHDVQGNGAATPIPGVTVTVEGIVTADFQGTNIQGFFLQEEDTDADADPATSEGIFIFCSSCPTPVAEGQRVQATGSVSEFNNLTEITASAAGSVVITNAGNNLAQVTPSPIDLPIAGVVNDFYEQREGMKVTFVDTLTVSEYFELGRYGQIILYEGGRPRQFTEANPPSVAGNTAWADGLSRRKVILDDDNNSQEWYLTSSSPAGPADGLQYVYHPRANGGFSIGTQGTDFFRGGDLVNGLTGVLHWSFAGQAGTDAWRIRPTAAEPATFTVANPRPATPPAVGGAIRAVGMNLLNYFTTIDTTASNSTGPCAPGGTLDCRGADSVAELNRQRARAALVICTLNADVYGFAELENTTPSDSITDLLGAVNALCGGAHPYAFVNTGGTLGTDAIRVQQIYRTGIVSPVGSPLSDLDPIHSRPPTAQTYDVVDATNPAFGQRFTVIINHFKSKGSSAGLPGDADIGDGAGASNATRTAQANRLLTWITGTVIPAAGDPDVLLLGDFNSYAKEDPINTLIAGGYTDLETLFHGASTYSYLFDGQLGHLDYGFASSSLLPQVTGADAWHINADEVDLFDYNDEIRDSPGEATFEEKPDGSALAPPRVVFQPGTPYRASDHDPVLVGLFQVADVAITKTDGVTTAVPGGSVTYTITASNAGPDPVTGGTVADTFPAVLTCTWTCVGAGGGTCTASGSGNLNDTVNLPAGGSVTYTASCSISASATGTLANTATVSGGAAGDPNPANNSATDTDTLTPQADLAITKTDGVTTVDPGGSVTYTITASSSGPSDAAGSTVADTFPADLTCNWTCAGAGGGTCTASGSGNINDTVNLPAGGSVTYTASCTVSAAATGTLSNTATVAAPGGVTDPSPGNNSATDSDTVSNLGDSFTVTPCRAVDTRASTPLQDGVPRTFALHGVCGIPPTAKVVVLNVTIVAPTGSGDLTIYAGDAAAPAFPTMQFPVIGARSLFVVVPLSQDAAGEVAVQASVAGSGTVHVVLDVLGYFE